MVGGKSCGNQSRLLLWLSEPCRSRPAPNPRRVPRANRVRPAHKGQKVSRVPQDLRLSSSKARLDHPDHPARKEPQEKQGQRGLRLLQALRGHLAQKAKQEQRGKQGNKEKQALRGHLAQKATQEQRGKQARRDRKDHPAPLVQPVQPRQQASMSSNKSPATATVLLPVAQAKRSLP